MKTDIRSIVESITEKALSTSASFLALCDAVQSIASESKKIAEMLLAVNERVNRHEKALFAMYSVIEKSNQNTKKDSIDFADLTKEKNASRKPN
jgi:hypothetical protein